MPVVDLRVRFGLPAASADDAIERRVVVGEHGDRAVALLVDVAREVLKDEQLSQQLKSAAAARRRRLQGGLS